MLLIAFCECRVTHLQWAQKNTPFLCKLFLAKTQTHPPTQKKGRTRYVLCSPFLHTLRKTSKNFINIPNVMYPSHSTSVQILERVTHCLCVVTSPALLPPPLKNPSMIASEESIYDSSLLFQPNFGIGLL